MNCNIHNTMDDKVLKVIEKLEKVRKETDNIYWNISSETAKFLYIWVKSMKAKNVLEIGTSNGYSGLWLASAISGNGGSLTTVESFQERFDLAEENFAEAGLAEVVNQVLGHAPEIIPDLQGEFDFAFFDATKKEHITYFDTVLPKLKTGGVIVVDNVVSHKEQLKEFIDYVDERQDVESLEVPLGSGLLMILKQ